jgi:RNA polymerase sigma-70 factor, ECF subfamily
MRVGRDQLLAELEALYEARLDAFVRTAAAITGERDSGRDAVHDAFISAIRNRSSYRRDAPLEAWLWRIVVRAALKTRERRDEVVELPEAAGDVSSNGQGEAASAIQAFVSELPERQRLILFLRYYADLDYEQIAAALEIRRGTVGAALHQAHAALRSRMLEVTRK